MDLLANSSDKGDWYVKSITVSLSSETTFYLNLTLWIVSYLSSLNFASSTTLLTSSCRSSSDLFVSALPVSVFRIRISLPQTFFGCPKFGVSRISGIFWVRGSWSMCRKAAMPRWPLERSKSTVWFGFSPYDCRTHNPIFSCRSFFELQAAFESFKCIPERYLRPTSLSNWSTVERFRELLDRM